MTVGHDVVFEGVMDSRLRGNDRRGGYDRRGGLDGLQRFSLI